MAKLPMWTKKVKLVEEDYPLVKPRRQRQKQFEKGETRILRYAKEPSFIITAHGGERRTKKYWAKLLYDGFEYTVDYGDERGLDKSITFSKKIAADIEFDLLSRELDLIEEQI